VNFGFKLKSQGKNGSITDCQNRKRMPKRGDAFEFDKWDVAVKSKDQLRNAKRGPRDN